MRDDRVCGGGPAGPPQAEYLKSVQRDLILQYIIDVIILQLVLFRP